MQPVTTAAEVPAPDRADVERRVVRIVSQTFGFAPATVTIHARLQDFPFDSLDVVELVMELEEEFHITISDEIAEGWFTKEPMTLRAIAEMVMYLQGSGKPKRADWRRAREALPRVPAVPPTQLGGRLAPGRLLQAPLYEPLGRNEEGHPEHRRQTDGMRCVLVPGDAAWVGSVDP